MSKLNLLCALCAALLLTACSTFFDKHIEYGYVEPDNYPVLKGIGYAPLSTQPGDSETEKMLMAIKASKLEAFRELAEQVYGHKVASNLTVQGAVAQNDQLQGQVQGIIRGAKVVKAYAVGDVYTTEVELDMKRVFDLYITEIKPRKVKRVTYY
ncbi:LPP20 family lipoprotein [Pseudoalteromonas xiamenensis]|uniref:LPP20 family lipoprotein n=1 Tax=Pseudoalteromonas xiamenensis TaxID=882626 RepID=UPI0027E421C6|nr:LPP20 family lipoprotein [Pseudoalteromonas xiamenensis]WMN59355.1 LPP20 family lipoprotein [Pseudoalteromonas xiamenensis]